MMPSFTFQLRSPLLLFAVLLLSTLFPGCNKDDGGPSINDCTNSWLLVNGLVYTVDESNPWAEAILIEDGFISFVGTTSQARSRAGDDIPEVDLGGNMVMPGFHDVHMHPIEASSSNFVFTLDSEETDPENYALDVQVASNENSGLGWLLGWGHSIFTVLDATRPPREILDDVAPNRPVAIMENTSHSIWCNTKALEAMDITASSPNPPGGVILRDSNGDPNGILIDNAGNLMIDFALGSWVNNFNNDYAGMVSFGLPELARHGITSVCDARTYWKRGHREVWQRLEDDGELTVRVNLGLWGYPADADGPQLQSIKSFYENDPAKLVKINQIKVYADGILPNTTAAMHTDYLIDILDQPTNNGLNYFSPQRLGDWIAELEPLGYDFHIHAIGNRGISEALDAIQQNGSGNGRHRITHCEIVRPEDLSRFAQLNVTADCQVAGDFSNPEHWAENEEFIGTALSDNLIPLKSLFDNNARITLSSDWDVSTLNPLVGLQNAVTRAPQELTLEEAIKGYTINAAYVMRQEDLTGSIEAGKAADLVVLNQNLFDISPNQISGVRVLTTYLEGLVVFE